MPLGVKCPKCGRATSSRSRARAVAACSTAAATTTTRASSATSASGRSRCRMPCPQCGAKFLVRGGKNDEAAHAQVRRPRSCGFEREIETPEEFGRRGRKRRRPSARRATGACDDELTPCRDSSRRRSRPRGLRVCVPARRARHRRRARRAEAGAAHARAARRLASPSSSARTRFRGAALVERGRAPQGRDAARGLARDERRPTRRACPRAARSPSTASGSARRSRGDLHAHPRIRVVADEVDARFPSARPVRARDRAAHRRRARRGSRARRRRGAPRVLRRDRADRQRPTRIDWDKVFRASRYDKGGDDAYVNCPFDEEQYEAFVAALLAAEKVEPREFEDVALLRGLPADRGDGRARPAHARVRSDEAGRAHRSAHRALAVRGRAAAPGGRRAAPRTTWSASRRA